MDSLAICLPFLSLILLVVFARRPLWLAAFLAFILATILWPMGASVNWENLFAPILRALLVAFDISLILLGAISFLEFLQSAGRTERIKAALIHMTAGNQVILVLLTAWLFCGFIEGAAGFGTPAAIVAPLLLSLGFHPITAAILPLIGNTTAVPFGAVGTPIRVGFAGVLVPGISSLATGINLIAALVPVFAIVWLCRRLAPEGRPDTVQTKDRIILAVQASFCFTIPAFLLSFFGFEFPSLFGALIGILFFLLITHRRRSMANASAQSKSLVTSASYLELIKSFFPYLLLCMGLLLGKVFLGDQRITWILADQSFSIAIFQPGLVFILIMVGLKLFSDDSRQISLAASLRKAAHRLPPVSFAIFCMASLAQYMMAFLDISQWLAEPAEAQLHFWQYLCIAIAPFLGAIGSFISGSATVSNLLFAGLLAELSQILKLPLTLLLALQLLGAGIGNMIALQNLVAVQATVGLKNAERDMLSKLYLPCLAYAVLTSFLGVIVFGIWQWLS